MKFSELLSKIAGLDPSKEYDIVEPQTEPAPTTSTTPEPQPNPEPTPPNNNDNRPTGADNSSTDELKKQLAEYEKTITELKATNLALLSHTSVKKPPTVDENILAVCGYKIKEE